MRLNKNFILSVCLCVCTVLSLGSAQAQTTDALGTYTPYSMYGVGDLAVQGTGYNRTMGGVGIGLRDNRFINYVNPAAITARDTLSFMLDFGVTQSNYYAKDHQAQSAYNAFSMQNFVFTTPLYKSSALVVGVAPYSNIGYKFESADLEDEVEAEIGDVRYQRYGTGSVSQLFVGAAATFFDRISVGGQMIYYFGSLNRHSNILFNSDLAYRNLFSGWDYSIHSISGKFGIQYEEILGKNRQSKIVIGGTYRLGTTLNGEMARYVFSSNHESITTNTAADTISFKQFQTGLSIPQEIGVGASFVWKDRWAIGVDYQYQDWSQVEIPVAGDRFTPMRAQSFRAGIQWTPNRYDIRYYSKRITYRGGFYYDQSYLGLDGQQINSMGVTLGVSLPISRWYNSLTCGVDLGKRGASVGELVQEYYCKFFLNINLHDIWFQKYRYE